MIITRTPYRIPLAGGGTDLDFYYKKRGGLFISATFNQFVFAIILRRQIDDKVLIQTTDTQFARSTNQVKHGIIREILKFFKIKNKIQVGTFATLPTSSGLGSSSSLIVGIIFGLSKMLRIKLSKKKIAKIAIFIERKKLKFQGGWQDQIISSYGGINKIKISKKGQFTVQKINIKKKILNKLERKLILVFTNETRDSSRIIANQKLDQKKTIRIYDEIKSYVRITEIALKRGDYKKIGEIFHEHWKIKKKLSKYISNSKLDRIYLNLLKEKSFIGGKLIGAGGGGFYLMVTEDINSSIKYLKSRKINFTRLKFVEHGPNKIREGSWR